MSDCTCPPTGWPETTCPKHGLYGDIRYPYVDRHARWIEDKKRLETAAEVQQRLYADSRLNHTKEPR